MWTQRKYSHVQIDITMNNDNFNLVIQRLHLFLLFTSTIAVS